MSGRKATEGRYGALGGDCVRVAEGGARQGSHLMGAGVRRGRDRCEPIVTFEVRYRASKEGSL